VHMHGSATDPLQSVVGTASGSVLAELAGLVASYDREVPIAATFPLNDVGTGFELLGQGHIRGKIVLLP
jgi:NADPH:quinone reductase-like Zn-dependent oxidoreductase